MNIEEQGNLDFTYRFARKGNILISRKGKLVTILRGPETAPFIEKIKSSSFSEQQQLMARVTGNYKRGNERVSKNHPRNR